MGTDRGVSLPRGEAFLGESPSCDIMVSSRVAAVAVGATLAVACVLLLASGGQDGIVAEETAADEPTSISPTIALEEESVAMVKGGKAAKKAKKTAQKAMGAHGPIAGGAKSQIAAAQAKSAEKKKRRLAAKKKKLKAKAKKAAKKLKLKKKKAAVKDKLIKKKLAATKKMIAKHKAKEIKKKSENTKKLVAQKRTIKRLHSTIKSMRKLHRTQTRSYKTQIHALDRLHVPHPPPHTSHSTSKHGGGTIKH